MLKDHNFSLFVTWPWFLRQTFVLPIYNLVSKQTVLKYHGLFPLIIFKPSPCYFVIIVLVAPSPSHNTLSLCVAWQIEKGQSWTTVAFVNEDAFIRTAKTLAIRFSWKNRKVSFFLLTFHFIPSDTEKLSSLFNWPCVEGGTLGSIIVLVTAGYFRNSA